MKGEQLKDVIVVEATPPDWPTYFVVTSSGVYEYTGQTFIKRETVPEGHSEEHLVQCLNRGIREVRGDGESAVILLDNGDVVVFDLEHNPFGSEQSSWPTVRCSSASAASSWADEYQEMDILFK